MCLAIPVRVEHLCSDERATVSVGGILRDVDVSLVDELEVGNYVILHVGFALSKIDEAEAAETLAMMDRAGLLTEAIDEIRG